MKTFKFYSDPGHGWLAVKEKDLEIVGLCVDDISPFSYHKGKTVYLEEDSDFSLFIKAYVSVFGNKPRYVEKHLDRSHYIRNYPRVK